MLKKYIILFTVLIVIVFGSLSFILNNEYNNEKDRISNKSENILSLESQKLILELEDVKTDLNYLSKTFRTHNNDDIVSDFIDFSNQKKRYDQIRFIDLNGMEKIRVDFRKSGSFAVTKENLQNKRNRYYFKNAINISRNSIYISPLDLNMERGAIEVPIKPMIRFATPVYNEQNEKIGIVVLNFLAQNILNKLRSIGNNLVGDLFLLNNDGYYFLSNDSSDEWGFMFADKSNLTFKNRSKVNWDIIKKNNNGVVEDDNGIYYYRTIDVDKILYGVNKIHCEGCLWKMVIFIPNSYLSDKLSENFIKYLPLILIIIAINAVLLWILIINYYRRKEHEDEIDRLNNQIINERDMFVAGPTVVFKFKNGYGWPVEYVSKNVKNILGYDSEEFLAGELDYSNIILPEYIDRFSQTIAEAKKNNIKWFEHEPYQVVRKDGTYIWLSDSIFIIRDENNNVTHLYGYIIDITALKDAQKAIEENSRYIKTVIDTIADPTVVIDIKTYEVVLYNKAAKQLYVGDDNIPTSIKCHQLSHSNNQPCEGKDDPCPIKEIIETKKKTRVTHRHYKKDGSIIHVELIAIPIFDKDNNVVQIIESHRDISHHIENENILKELASTDNLTKAYNRTKFDEILEKYFIKAKSDLIYFGLIMFDIDHFKNVNDTYGHDVGDSVLIEISTLIKQHIREHDILVRWGGEEFMIYIPNCNNNILKDISEHLRKNIEEYNFKYVETITASFGATLLRSDDSVESLIKRVDTGLYGSKESGRNKVTVV